MSMHPLLRQQFEASRDEDGSLDMRKLLRAISDAYTEWDEERRGVARSMRLLADETSAFTREVRESAAAQFQVILDHVKDAIITVDETGRIETLNATGERVFGYEEAAVRGQRLDLLVPSLARRPRITESLDELAESVENTQVDLAPHETRGRHRNGLLFDAEIGVSKVQLDRREFYIVCLRETTDRKIAEAAIRESEARYRTLVENAPEAIVVLDVDVEPLRRVQRERGALLQDDARRTAVRRARQGQPPDPDGRLAFLRHGAGAYRSRAGRRGAVLRMAAPRCAGTRHTLRSAPGAPALVRPPTDPRQHHGHHRAQAQRNCSRPASDGCSSVSPGTPTSPPRSKRSPRPPNRSRPTPLARSRSTTRGRTSCTRSPACACPMNSSRPAVASRSGRATAPAPPRSSCSGRSSWPRSRATRSGSTSARRRSPRACAPAGPRRSARRTTGCSARSHCISASPAARCRRDFELMSRLTALAGDRDRAQALRGRPAPQRGAVSRPVRERHRRRLPVDRRRQVRVGESGARADARLRERRGTAARYRPRATLYVDRRRARPGPRRAAPRAASCARRSTSCGGATAR